MLLLCVWYPPFPLPQGFYFFMSQVDGKLRNNPWEGWVVCSRMAPILLFDLDICLTGLL